MYGEKAVHKSLHVLNLCIGRTTDREQMCGCRWDTGDRVAANGAGETAQWRAFAVQRKDLSLNSTSHVNSRAL